MDDIVTRTSLNAFTEATTKSATEMEKIVSTLQILIEKQDKMVEKITNGMVSEIVEGVMNNYNATHKETIECLKRVEECAKEVKETMPNVVKEVVSNSVVAKDIEHVKWFVAIVGIAIIVSSVIMRNIDNRALLSQEIKAFQKAIAIESQKEIVKQ